MRNNELARLLAYVTSLVNQQLRLQNEYLAAENRICERSCPSDCSWLIRRDLRSRKIGKEPGHKALEQVACVAKPDTILGWYRRLIARKFDGSKNRAYPGRPTIGHEVSELVGRMARENSGWGYDRIVGALLNLGFKVSHQTVGNILRRHGIPPAPKRSANTTWKDFIATHMAVLAGVDFFSVEVLTWRGLVTYYVLCFLHLESRQVSLAGITRHPNEEWMAQMARNAIDEAVGHLRHDRYMLRCFEHAGFEQTALSSVGSNGYTARNFLSCPLRRSKMHARPHLRPLPPAAVLSSNV
jgi:putative transposase